MIKKTSVSVVIPCYNAEKTIIRALDSIMAQSQLPYEIILVDDKSTDKSCELIKNYIKRYEDHIKITLIELEENSGPAKARNTGWDNAVSDYIAFLDADDSWHLQKIELQYNYMLEHPEVMLSGHLYEVVTWKPEIKKEKIENVEKITKSRLLIKNRFGTSTVMIKKDISLRFRVFKKYSEDYLLWAEIVLSGNISVILKSQLGYMHKAEYGVSGLSGDMINMWKGSLKNFSILYKEKYIGYFMYRLLMLYSTMKFIIRLIKVRDK